MSNPEDEGRFLKSVLFGVPQGIGLTRSEQNLKALTEISQGLSGMRRQLQPATFPTSAPQPTFSQQTSVQVNVPDMAGTLSPYLVDLSQQQQATTAGIGALAKQGRASLRLQDEMANQLDYQSRQGDMLVQQGGTATAQRNTIITQENVAIEQREGAAMQRQTMIENQSRLAVMVLESLAENGRIAYVQRQRLLAGLCDTREAIEKLDGDFVDGVNQISNGLQDLHAQGDEALQEMRIQTNVLDSIAQLESLGLAEAQLQNQNLRRIGGGIAQLVAIGTQSTDLLERQNVHLSRIVGGIAEQSAITGRIEDGVSRVVETLELVVLTANTIAAKVGQVIGILKNPIKVKAHNLWEIGEQCRKTGDLSLAFHKFEESFKEDPSNAQNYYSLAMLCLEFGAMDAAGDFFSTGIKYTTQNPELETVFLMQLGKLAYISGDFQKAKFLLEKALATDKKNIDVWYELALVEMKLNDPEKAIYYLNNLLAVARRKAPAYIMKVFNDPAFSTILTALTQ
ncbi:MAG: tetratricopeptide repeat protein [Patescibacteria group bacterium]